MVLRILQSGGLKKTSEQDYFKSKKKQEMDSSRTTRTHRESIDDSPPPSSSRNKLNMMDAAIAISSSSSTGKKKKKKASPDKEKKKTATSSSKSKSQKVEKRKSKVSTKSSGTLEEHLSLEPPIRGTTIGTYPTAPLSPSSHSPPPLAEDSYDSPKDKLPSRLSAWQLRESFKEAESPGNTQSSYRKKSHTSPVRTTKPNRKLRDDTKLEKRESKLRQRQQSGENKEMPKTTSPKREEKLKRTSLSKKTHSKKMDPSETLLQNRRNETMKQTKSDGTAPHNRPGVAHHKSSPDDIVPILENMPIIVSYHSKHSKDPSIDDDNSLASFNSTLTPSVVSYEANEEAMDVFEDSDDEEDTAADPSKVSDRFMEKPSPLKRQDDPMERPVPAWKLRESMKGNSDARPAAPRRQLSILGDVDDLDDDDSSSKILPVPRRWTPKTNGDLPAAFAAMANHSSKRSLLSESASSRNLYTSMSDMSDLKAKDDDDSSSKILTVPRRWTPKANADLPPAFAAMSESFNSRSSFSLYSKDDDDSNAHSKSVKKTLSSTLRKMVPHHEDKEDKVAKDKASEALKSKLASRWSQMSEMRNSGHTRSSAVKTEPPKRKDERIEEGTGGQEKNHMKRIEEKRSKSTDLLSHSSHSKSSRKSHPKSSRIVDPKKTTPRRNKSIDSNESKSLLSKSSSSSSRPRSQSVLIEEKRSKSTDLLSHSSHSKSSRSKSSSSLQCRSQSAPKSSQSLGSKGHSKPKRQPRSLAQPEKLAPWQIREQAKHRATAPTAVNNLYNRRLDDDDEDKPEKPKVRRTSSKNIVSAVASPRCTQRANGTYVGVEERKKLKKERSTHKNSIIGHVSQFDDSECNLPPAFRNLSKPKK